MPISVLNEAVIPPGTMLLDKYEVVRELGRGGMAVVYEAMHCGLGQPVAVKVLASELIKSSVVKERFIREARAVAAIKSAHIVDVYDTGVLADGRPYIAMELLRGETLYERLAAKGRIDVTETAAIVRDCAAGLQNAHDAGIVHRDLKPENVFLCVGPSGEQSAKLLDFGLAKVHTAMGEQAGRLTRDGAVFGTPAYMSPEQLKGQASVDHRADLWALGCITYECLTGRSVWATNQSMAMTFAAIATAPLPVPTDFRPDAPLAFNDWFARALQRDPAKRFQSARALSESLALAFSSDLVSVDYKLPAPGNAFDVRDEPAETSGHVPIVTTIIRRGGTAGLVVGAMGVVVGVGGMAAYYMEHQKHDRDVADVRAATAAQSGADASRVHSAHSLAGPTGPAAMPVWSKQLAEGQRRLAGGDTAGAALSWREAAASGATSTATGLLEQLKVASTGSGACSVAALGHPRPATSRSAGRPAVIPTKAGVLVAWTDDHEHAGHEHVYASLLGENLQSETASTTDLSPEADSAFRPFFLQEGNDTALVFADRGGPKPGIFARFLDAESHLAGELVHVGGDKPFTYYVHAHRSQAGYQFLWEDDRDGAPNIFLSHTDARLVPDGGARRVTSFAGSGALARVPRYVSGATADGQLVLSYALESGRGKVALEALSLAWPVEGLPTPAARAVTKRERAGTVVVLADHKVDAPLIACEGVDCYVAWQAVPAGVHVTRFNPRTKKKVWDKLVSAKGTTPSIVANGQGGIVLAFVDSGTVRVANVSAEGVAQPGVFAKTSVTQHRPYLAPGRQSGEWYVAWLDMENMHLEPYVAKLRCPR